jgi:hypothetical protein
MRTVLIVAVSSLALVGCYRPWRHHFGELRAVSQLTCPQTEGDLTRTNAAADGKTCNYSGPDGAVVTLQILSLTDSDPNATLQPVEAKLRGEIPTTADAPDTAGGQGPGQGRVDIDLPGIHIHASGRDNDHGSGNVQIGSDDGHGGPGSVNITAHDKGAEVRINDGHGGIRRKVIFASDTAGPNGYKVAGYDARGPQGGPLVVASILAKTDDQDRFEDDITQLLRINVGGH